MNFVDCGSSTTQDGKEAGVVNDNRAATRPHYHTGGCHPVWALGVLTLFSIILALVASALLYLVLRRVRRLRAIHLLAGGGFYAVFLIAALVSVL